MNLNDDDLIPVKDQVIEQTTDQVWDQVWEQVRDPVFNQIIVGNLANKIYETN